MGATVFYESTSELATLTNTFSVAGVATDPTTVSLAVTTPSGTTTTYTWAGGTITHGTAGVFTKDVACTEDGLWQYVWTGTGTASDVVAGTFTVFNTDLQRNYCSLEELKSRLGVSASDTVDDFELKLAVETASRWIDQYCGRQFWRGTDTRVFVPDDSYELDIDDLVSVTTLKTDSSGDGTYETTWDTTDYQLQPVNPQVGPEQRPYTYIRAVGTKTFPIPYVGARNDLVQIVGVFGWPAVPVAVKQAALIIAAEYMKLKDAPFGVAGFGEYGVVRVQDNPKAAGLLRPYRARMVFG